MMAHEPLPNRRDLARTSVRIGGQRVYLDLGFYADGRVGELFLACEQTGSQNRWMYDEAARLASKLLQYGMPVEELAEGWLGSKGAPAGPVQGHPQIKNCVSILDAVARVLLIEYCGREDLAHIKQPVAPEPEDLTALTEPEVV